jgi:hypothetical protein
MKKSEASVSEAGNTFDAFHGETLDEARLVRPASASRKTLLQDGAAEVGVSWAHGLCESMQREGRPIEGEWPGTVGEARAFVAGRLSDTLARQKMSPLTGGELSAASVIAYAQARQHWLVVRRQVKRAARHAATSE